MPRMPSTLILLVSLALTPPAAMAQDMILSLGARVMFSSWKGSNDGSGGTDFDGDGAQGGINATLQRGRWYAGLSLQGGKYDFDGTAPDVVRANSVTPTRATTLERGEFDLSLGYFFWDQVSLFVDFKGSGTNWLDDDQKLGFGGLGLGISGFHPLDERWTFFGTLGFVPLTIEDGDDEIGDGSGRGLEIGLRYRLGERTSLSFSLKNQHQELDFDNGAEQRHDIGGLMIGYQYGLPL